MKKAIFLFATVLALGFAATAQTKSKGMDLSPFKKQDFIAEGTLAFLAQTGQPNQYTFAPSIGYFVTDRVAAGINAEFVKSTLAETNNFGAFGRCYFTKVLKSVHVYSQLDMGRKSDNFATGLGIGANYFVSKRVALSTQLVDLMNFSSGGGVTKFAVGFSGINNPLATYRFGVLVKL